VQIPLGHRGAPIGRLRDRAGPERAADRTAATLRPLLAALLGPMLVLRPHGTLARMVRRRARWHAGALGRARSGDGTGSPRTCYSVQNHLLSGLVYGRRRDSSLISRVTELSGGGCLCVGRGYSPRIDVVLPRAKLACGSLASLGRP